MAAVKAATLLFLAVVPFLEFGLILLIFAVGWAFIDLAAHINNHQMFTAIGGKDEGQR